MFLKSLTLKGFKSFAETTTLEFEPGITVVVGPNGSGKSNVVDAVAWVLGAQGPRTVRSSKMEDVIFAGSAKKPALGRAEVSLTIDNSSGVLPIGFAEVTLTRTLFRNGDSEYAINGVPCRLLDIQELLSDSGVGRQQHVIVSQGQLDAVLNARPEERRAVIEEAAGVLKYRRRREKAQRRLEATEGNFVRLQDLLREVRRQLRPLERQADAARRHGSLVSELQGIRLHLAGRELASLRARAEAVARTKADQATLEASVVPELARLDADVMQAEAALTAQGGDDLSEVLMRLDSLRERGRGLAAVITERRRSIERDRLSFVDQAVIASLETDAARLRSELEEVESESAALIPRADELVASEDALAQERVDFEKRWGDGTELSTPGGEAAEVRGELGALRASVERGEAEMARVRARLDALEQKASRLEAEGDRLRAELQQADEAEQPMVAALEAAEVHRAAAEAALGSAESARRAAESEWHAWTARAEALGLALDQARARAGAERLADVAGVVGTLLDLVDVDEGWQAAFEAAIGEAVAAVVVDGVASARAALERLHDEGAAGAVLALDAPIADLRVVAVDGASSIRNHVRSTNAGVDPLLDLLLHAAVVVDGKWHDALDLAIDRPDLVVVTRDGSRFASAGWRTGVSATGATGAALDEARRRGEEAQGAAGTASQHAERARSEVAEARTAEAELARSLDANDSRLSAASDALQRLEGERRDAITEIETLRSHVAEVSERTEREAARVAELDAALPELQAAEAAGAERVVAMRSARTRLDEQAAAVGALRTDLDVRAAGLEERRGFLARRLAEVDDRLKRNVAERDAAEARRTKIESAAKATERLAALVERRLEIVEGELDRVRARRQRQSEQSRATADRLDGVRRARAAAERQLGELREKEQRAAIDEAEVKMRLENAIETVRREFDVEPEAAIVAECPEMPAGSSAPNRVRELERELRLMGPINPLALEEHDALQERHTFLEAQLEDVKSSRRELAKVIKAIDAEIVEIFRAAYVDVELNFEKLFSTLFPGGTGRIRLTNPDDLLNTGIEVEARPSGKNVRQLSLLSGGERSLTALAFLFAVFRSRPSPFYLMDEVEAALDDVNLHRFLDLIAEFRREAQLVIVSHQKRTMEAADVLYGVTMEPGGSSRVITEKVSAGT